MKYTDIAWDFDGTLYDSYPFIVFNLKRALDRFGYEQSEEQITEWARKSVPIAMDHYVPLCGCTRDEFRAVYRERAGTISDLVTPYEELRAILKAVCDSGRRNHVCTNRSVVSTRQFLERDGLLQYFDLIVGPDLIPETFPRKPEPDMIAYIHNERSVAPERLLMIGDRSLDIESARNAGSFGCFFDPDHFHVTPFDADRYALSMEELRAILLED